MVHRWGRLKARKARSVWTLTVVRGPLPELTTATAVRLPRETLFSFSTAAILRVSVNEMPLSAWNRQNCSPSHEQDPRKRNAPWAGCWGPPRSDSMSGAIETQHRDRRTATPTRQTETPHSTQKSEPLKEKGEPLTVHINSLSGPALSTRLMGALRFRESCSWLDECKGSWMVGYLCSCSRCAVTKHLEHQGSPRPDQHSAYRVTGGTAGR